MLAEITFPPNSADLDVQGRCFIAPLPHHGRALPNLLYLRPGVRFEFITDFYRFFLFGLG